MINAVPHGLQGCGGSSPSMGLDNFTISPAERAAIDDLIDKGAMASGHYSFDQAKQVLTLTFEDSTFDCVGPQSGETRRRATGGDINHSISWTDDEGNTVAWSRVDHFSGAFVGIWKHTDSRIIYLIMYDDDRFNWLEPMPTCP